MGMSVEKEALCDEMYRL